jgi:hypothetical protein
MTKTKPIFKYHHQNAELNYGIYESYEVISKYGRVQVSGKASKNKKNARTKKLRTYFQRMFGFLQCRKFYLPACCRKTQRLKQNLLLSTSCFVWI